MASALGYSYAKETKSVPLCGSIFTGMVNCLAICCAAFSFGQYHLLLVLKALLLNFVFKSLRIKCFVFRKLWADGKLNTDTMSKILFKNCVKRTSRNACIIS